jgi:parallel beta-helix repeat protein
VNPLGGISLDWAYIWDIKNIYIKDFANASAIGFKLKDCFNIKVESCQANLYSTGYSFTNNSIFTNSSGTGVSISSSSSGQNVTQISIDDCLFQYNKIGILIDCDTSADGFTITNSGLGKNETALKVDIGSLFNTRISENHIEYSLYGIVANSSFRNNDIINNYFYDVDAGIIFNTVGDSEINKNTFNGQSVVRVNNTAYVIGNRVSCNDKIYICSKAGTSGLTAPSTTGTGISDGTCEWDYIKPIRVPLTATDSTNITYSKNIVFSGSYGNNSLTNTELL